MFKIDQIIFFKIKKINKKVEKTRQLKNIKNFIFYLRLPQPLVSKKVSATLST